MKVAVIGAGASGLCVAKHSLSAGYDVIVYEQTSDIGGVWQFSPDPKAHSAMYEDLVTNMPKQLMEFENVPFEEDVPTFPDYQMIWNYLKKYSEGIPIEFNTKVISIEQIGNEWKVTTASKGSTSVNCFDSVFVCSGHFVEPSKGIDWSAYKRDYIHSHDYRRASDYENLTVAVIGTGLSGMDISLQLAKTAKKVILIGHKKYDDLPLNITHVKGHVTGATSDSILLSEGEDVRDVDVIIDCSGYRFSFPFLSEDLVKVTHNGKVVSPLWRFVAHKHFPNSLFFIGLNELSLTMPIYDHQVKFALALLSGKISAPELNIMEEWDKTRFKQVVDLGYPEEDFHKIPYEQYDYMRDLAKIGQFTPMKNLELIEKLNNFVDGQRNSNITGYKNMKIKLTEEGFDFSGNMKIVPQNV